MPLVSLAFAILHLSYGFGFLTGLFRFASRWREPKAAPSGIPFSAPAAAPGPMERKS
jgi:hypothetical protein